MQYLTPGKQLQGFKAIFASCLISGYPGIDYLAEAVDNDESSSQEVTVGRVLSHDVLVPQLDGHQSPKQLAQLLDQQVKLPLGENTKLETAAAEERRLDASIK